MLWHFMRWLQLLWLFNSPFFMLKHYYLQHFFLPFSKQICFVLFPLFISSKRNTKKKKKNPRITNWNSGGFFFYFKANAGIVSFSLWETDNRKPKMKNLNENRIILVSTCDVGYSRLPIRIEIGKRQRNRAYALWNEKKNEVLLALVGTLRSKNKNHFFFVLFGFKEFLFNLYVVSFYCFTIRKMIYFTFFSIVVLVAKRRKKKKKTERLKLNWIFV